MGTSVRMTALSRMRWAAYLPRKPALLVALPLSLLELAQRAFLFPSFTIRDAHEP